MAIIINPYTIPSFFAGILSLILGCYALYKNPKERITQVFFIMMLACAVWSLTPLIIQASVSTGDALSWAKISNSGFILIPVTLFHFSFLFQRKKVIEFYKIAIIYIISIIMILLLIGTNLFFTMADDKLIDGDGELTNGRGDGKYNEDDYFSLPEEDLEYFYFMDTNDDGDYTIESETIEPLGYRNITLVGQMDDSVNLTQLKNASNYLLVWFVDENQDGNYTLGESLYLENYDGDQKLTYNYIIGPLYYILILFFFGFLIASIVNLFLFYRKMEDPKIKRSISYLIFGLIAIILFILSQSFLAFLIPLIILDSFIALIISIFFTVAVLKYNIIDIKLIIRKSMFYSLASLIVVGSFVLVEETMEMLFSELAFSGSILSGVIAAFVALIMFSAIKKGLRKQIDRFFPAVKLLDKEYQNRITAYKATIFAMLADGILSPKEQSAIDILRNKLDISLKEHEELMKSIQLELRMKPGTSYGL